VVFCGFKVHQAALWQKTKQFLSLIIPSTCHAREDCLRTVTAREVLGSRVGKWIAELIAFKNNPPKEVQLSSFFLVWIVSGSCTVATKTVAAAVRGSRREQPGAEGLGWEFNKIGFTSSSQALMKLCPQACSAPDAASPSERVKEVLESVCSWFAMWLVLQAFSAWKHLKLLFGMVTESKVLTVDPCFVAQGFSLYLYVANWLLLVSESE